MYYNMNSTITPGDYESLTTYIRNRLKNNSNRTKQKYLVILHGPSSSGKSNGTKVACRLIYDYFEKTIPLDQLKTTFMNTNIDDLTYDTITINNITVKKELLDNLYSTVYGVKIQHENLTKLDPDDATDFELVKSMIANLVSTSFEIYRNYRPDNVSEIMFYLSVFMGLNIFSLKHQMVIQLTYIV